MEEQRILLGSWLLEQNLDDISQFTDEDFPNYAQVFRLIREGRNALSISKATGLPISELAKMQSEYTYVFYRQIVEDVAKRKILAQLSRLSSSKEDISLIREKIDWILNSRKVVEPATRLAEIFGNEMIERADSEQVSYGIPTLDNFTGGLKKKELTVIAARPSVGKSAVALQIADHVQAKGNKVLYFPLEMTTMQTMERLLIRQGIADGRSLMTGKISKESYAEAVEFLQKFEKHNKFMIYEGQSDIEKIHSVIKHEKPKLVVIDQLTQLKSNKRFNSIREKFSYMTNSLKAMAMSENVSIILLCQVNRDAQNLEPTMANLKESGSIEEDADNIILLHRIDKGDLNNPNEWHELETAINVNLAKHRAGQTGEFLMAFRADRMRFYEKVRI